MKFLSNTLYKLNFDYMGKVRYTTFISLLLIVASIFSLSTNWLNLGMDFTGGVTLKLQAKKTVNTDDIRKILKDKGIKDAQVIQYSTEKNIQIKLPPIAGNEKNLAVKLQDMLKKDSDYSFKLLEQSVIGPQFGQELIDSGLYALTLVLFGIMIYLSIRFQWKLALGAVTALAHDLIITLGFFSFTHIEFNLTVLAALLAVLGYSVNDTVVVFDRIRENFRLLHSENESKITNKSINQTMIRTLITSFTTLLSVIALAVFGGQILFGFAVALIIGIIVGTYSSIFVASALAIKLKLTKEDLITKKPEEIDDMP